MSLYKVDGRVLSVEEFHAWAMSFVILHRKGRLANKKLPSEVREIMTERDNNLAARSLMEYLKITNENFMPALIKLVRDEATDLVIEKGAR